MHKCANMRRVPAKASIEGAISIIGLIISLIDAIYNLIMKIFFGVSY